MKIFRLIVETIIVTTIGYSEIITINNDDERLKGGIEWSVNGTIEIEVQKDNNFIIGKIKRGVIKGSNNKNLTKRFVRDIRLCIGEDITKRWNIEICSQEYKIDKILYNNQLMELEQHEFIIPIRSIGKEHNKKWFIIQITNGEKNIGTCYMHNRNFKLDKLDKLEEIKIKK